MSGATELSVQLTLEFLSHWYNTGTNHCIKKSECTIIPSSVAESVWAKASHYKAPSVYRSSADNQDQQQTFVCVAVVRFSSTTVIVGVVAHYSRCARCFHC